MSTKILFCRHNNVLFWKRKDTFKKQNIDKISLRKGLTVAKSVLSSECSAMLNAQPVTVYPASPRSPDDPSRNSKLDFVWNVTAFIFWPLFCRQLSPSRWTWTRHVDKEICPRRRHYPLAPKLPKVALHFHLHSSKNFGDVQTDIICTPSLGLYGVTIGWGTRPGIW